MPVGRAFRHNLGREVAAGARAVLHHHLLAPALGELLANRAREDVARPAGREADDEAHRLGGKVGGLRAAEACDQRKGYCRQPASHTPY
jgi:hypothetical protein